MIENGWNIDILRIYRKAYAILNRYNNTILWLWNISYGQRLIDSNPLMITLMDWKEYMYICIILYNWRNVVSILKLYNGSKQWIRMILWTFGRIFDDYDMKIVNTIIDILPIYTFFITVITLRYMSHDHESITMLIRLPINVHLFYGSLLQLVLLHSFRDFLFNYKSYIGNGRQFLFFCFSTKIFINIWITIRILYFPFKNMTSIG